MLCCLSVNLHAAVFDGLPFGLFTFEQDGVVAVFGKVRRSFRSPDQAPALFARRVILLIARGRNRAPINNRALLGGRGL
jgi:hypothetical protein